MKPYKRCYPEPGLAWVYPRDVVVTSVDKPDGIFGYALANYHEQWEGHLADMSTIGTFRTCETACDAIYRIATSQHL